MTTQELKQRIAAAVDDHDLTETDLPSIDLYLDQILSLLSEKNRASSLRYRKRMLTKTMVNNYSKDGLISPIEGKKYRKEQIIEMLLVYALKNTLSIGEIKRVLLGVRGNCGFNDRDLADGYGRFLLTKEHNRKRTSSVVEEVIKEDGLNIEDDRDFFVALLDILSLSAYLKTVAQEMLETRYTDPDKAIKELRAREKNERREKSEAEKQQKRELAEREKQEKKKEKNAEVPPPEN